MRMAKEMSMETISPPLPYNRIQALGEELEVFIKSRGQLGTEEEEKLGDLVDKIMELFPFVQRDSIRKMLLTYDPSSTKFIVEEFDPRIGGEVETHLDHEDMYFLSIAGIKREGVSDAPHNTIGFLYLMENRRQTASVMQLFFGWNLEDPSRPNNMSIAGSILVGVDRRKEAEVEAFRKACFLFGLSSQEVQELLEEN